MSATEVANPAGVLRLLFSEPPRAGVRPGILLDRDGIINKPITGGYVTGWSQFRFVPGIVEALAMLSEMGLPIVVVSNQACVDKGLLEASELAAITARFVACVREASARIDAVYYCPHRPELGCECRKPRPGLLRLAAREWRLDLSRSVLVGDSVTDVEAANAAGCQAIWLRPKAGAITVEEVREMGERVCECLRGVQALPDDRGSVPAAAPTSAPATEPRAAASGSAPLGR